MDVRAARGGERMLRRSIALLVAFAVLAERAAARSTMVRWFVLWILRRAETAAEEIFLERAGTPLPVLGRIALAGNAPEDALHLAARFRALAAAFCALLPTGLRPDRRFARRGFVFDHAARGSGRFPGGGARMPHDTS